MLPCYIINLDRAAERWMNITASPGIRDLNVIRVPAVDGQTLSPPYPNFSAWGYFLCSGRKPNPNMVACFNSHLKAVRTFLDSGSEYGIICEDDVIGTDELLDVLKDVLRYSDSWDFVRLTGFKQKTFLPFAPIYSPYRLVSDLFSSTSAGAYLINRRAAIILNRCLVPMRANPDVSLFYGVPNGIREATVQPFPILLSELKNQSTIGYAEDRDRYPLLIHCLNRFTAIPYRLFTRTWRILHRFRVGLLRYWLPPKPAANRPE
jgi:glycosyl transferase family 25